LQSPGEEASFYCVLLSSLEPSPSLALPCSHSMLAVVTSLLAPVSDLWISPQYPNCKAHLPSESSQMRAASNYAKEERKL
jgi:hypothetical protein